MVLRIVFVKVLLRFNVNLTKNIHIYNWLLEPGSSWWTLFYYFLSLKKGLPPWFGQFFWLGNVTGQIVVLHPSTSIHGMNLSKKFLFLSFSLINFKNNTLYLNVKILHPKLPSCMAQSLIQMHREWFMNPPWMNHECVLGARKTQLHI